MTDAADPPIPRRKRSWVVKRIRENKKREKKIRKERELSRIDIDILAIQGVARMLHVSVDTVRKIPFSELPYTKEPGRRHLYDKEDVVRYLRSKINEHRDVGKNSRVRKRLIDSEADSVRGRST